MARPTHPVDPPWLFAPEWPAGHIAWRMGPGEDALNQWIEWLCTQTTVHKRAYFSSLAPIPEDWLMLAAELLADPDDTDAAYAEARVFLEAPSPPEV